MGSFRPLVGGVCLCLPAFDLGPAAGLPGRGQSGTVVVADAEKSFPPAHVGFAVRPSLGPLDGGSRLPGPFQEFQRAACNPVLHSRVPRLAAGVAEREVHEQEAWHAALLDDVPGRADDDGRNAGGFQVPCDQTHGLVTDGSKRDEKGDVDTVLAHPGFDLGRIVLDGESLAVVRRDAIESRIERPEMARRDMLRQSGER